MKNSPRPIGQVRRVLNAALEINAHQQLNRHRWEWIAKWMAGADVPPLPHGLNLVAEGKPFRLEVTKYRAFIVPLEG